MLAALSSDLQYVAEALGDQQHRVGPLPGQPGIGGDGRAVDEARQIADGAAGSLEQPLDALDDGIRAPAAGGHLVDNHLAGRGIDQHQIRERPTDIGR